MKFLYLVGILLTIAIITSVSLVEADQDIDELINKGVQLFNSEQYEEALSYLNEVLEKDPDNLQALNAKGAVFVKIERYEEALTYFDKILEMDPSNVDALNNKVVTLGKLDRGNEAAQYVQRVLELDPAHIEALISQGQVHIRMGEYEEALSYFESAVEIDPNHIEALNAGGQTIIKMGKTEDALPYFDRVLEQNPDHIEALIGKGVVLARIGKVDEAVRDYFDVAFNLDQDRVGLPQLRTIAFSSLPYYSMKGDGKFLVRDSDGRLVSYVEGLKVTVLNNTLTDLLLEKFEVKDVITRDGQDYEVLERTLNSIEKRIKDSYFMTGTTGINVHQNGTFINAISSSNHHGYLTQTGEFVSISWTLIRPIS